MSGAIVRPRSVPTGAPRSNEWRWICRDHDRLRVGRWTGRTKAHEGAEGHNLKEHR